MKSTLLKIALTYIVVFGLYSCGTDDSDDYTPIAEKESPVVLNLEAVPYTNLSEYNFFEGELKNLEPVYKVLPYDINSSLFTDYALKKRFIWMPKNTTATYTTDGHIPTFPVGTALIKNFYYNTVLPDNSTKVMETRIMIKKAEGWIFAEYVWNEEQTDAVLTTERHVINISWNQNGTTMSTGYTTPSTIDCAECHTLNDNHTPIGVKPQNLNKTYPYANGSQNQLDKWIAEGYLNSKPNTINTTIDWTDTTQPLELRVRSYLDINCAHCHSAGTSCDYTPMELSFQASDVAENLGICVQPIDFAIRGQDYIVAGQDVNESLMHYRMSTVVRSEMMPNLGRTVVDEQAILLVEDWINSLETTCP
ncbi:hypothetical protein [Flavobacterium litorale]|uniref:Repeat protein (TIGR03806 family) n=1 Tax=Flavobacterium litorale TaxID=2856519 RepID=A0ABX8V5S8_9FLAO|nr:hypothetical protein [Flavobacterium litorale]QYJ68193.1 hypothetical protein K1I41_11795 [Flavobacterium litorale]